MPRLGFVFDRYSAASAIWIGLSGTVTCALVLRVVDRRPARRRRRDRLRVVEQRVRAPLQRDAVVLAVDRVVRRRLQLRDEVLPVRDQRRRSSAARRRRGSAAGSRRRRRRPCRTATPPPWRISVTISSEEPRVLGVHLAAGLLLERLDPLGLRVALPRDQVELALALADRRRQVARRRAARASCRRRRTPTPISRASRARPPRWPGRILREPRSIFTASSSSVSACRAPTACCGRQASRTRRPRSCQAPPRRPASRFCRSATSVSPWSSSTT